jgi:putative tryptophan/tyrosine transport system substrate-binding protein
MTKMFLARTFGLHSDNPKSKTCPELYRRIQNRKWAGLFAIVVALTVCGARAEAQQPTKIPRIGFLITAPLFAIPARTEAFRQGLRELRYVEGENFVIEWRSAEGKLDRLPALAAELVRLKVDIIVSAGPQPTRAAKDATTTIPIVMAQDPDPVGNGFVASLARPGGNITGLATLRPEISGKQLELLKEIIPKLSRVAVFGTSTNPGNVQQRREIELAAGAFRVKLQFLDVLSPKDIETAFRAAGKERADAVLILVAGSIATAHRTEIVELTVKSHLPAIYNSAEFVEAGGLMSYATSSTDLFRRAATYVDKILKGAKPADLAVEQPTKFELVINLKAAKQIGLTIPPGLLARADRVIK